MAVVGKRTTNTWTNLDGLFIPLGVSEATATNTGQYVHTGGLSVVEVIIDCANLPTQASGNVQIQDDSVTIPLNAFIEEIRLTVLKETTGVNAALNIGLVDQDRSTEIDFDGFIAANTAVNDGTDLGESIRIAKGGTSAGALLGTKITNAGLIVAFPTTASFTAGVVKCEVFYSMPLSTDVV